MDRREFIRAISLLLTGSFIYGRGYGSDHGNREIVKRSEECGCHNVGLDESLLNPEQPLRPLNLLKNESNQKGVFKAVINVEKTKLEIAKGFHTDVFAYNGTIPAPKIVLNEGDKVQILVKNNLDDPTTVHWHGMIVPYRADGAPMNPIEPGGEYSYEFPVLKGTAGTYWYHPHPLGFTPQQVAMGLAGALVVKSKDALSHLSEQDWMISDISLDGYGNIPPHSTADWMDGREGSFVLINGQFRPQISIESAQRIRIYNCCAARYLNLAIEGASFILVGTDGGLLEKAREVRTLLIVPAQRVEVIIKSSNSGHFKLTSLFYDRRKMMDMNPDESPLTLATIAYTKHNISLPKKLRTIPKLGPTKDLKRIELQERKMNHARMMQMKFEDMKGLFMINGKTFDPGRFEFTSKVGKVEDWLVKNVADMDHPFHIHGTQFEVIERIVNGETKKPKFRALLDTVNVSPNETVKLRMKHHNPGMWMFHCHILEHEHLGMMSMLRVIMAPRH